MKASEAPAWSSLSPPSSPPPSSPPPPPPSVEEPGLYTVETYAYSNDATHSGYEEKDNDKSGIGTFKSGQDVSREAGAGVKALSLLDHEFGPGQTPCDLTNDNSMGQRKKKDKGVSEYKSDRDKYRESQSQSLALRLLSKSVAKEKKSVAKQAMKTPNRSFTAHHGLSQGRSLADEAEDDLKTSPVQFAAPNPEKGFQYNSPPPSSPLPSSPPCSIPPSSPLPSSPLPSSPLPSSPLLSSPLPSSPLLSNPLPNSPLPSSPLPNSPLPSSPLPSSPLPSSPLPSSPLPSSPLPSSPPPSSPPAPPPSVQEPGLYPVETYAYSNNASHSGYEEKDNDQSGIGTFKSGQDVSREVGAGVKALSLLDQEFGPGLPPCDLTDDDSGSQRTRRGSSVAEYKSDRDRYRESQSQSLALRLLSKSVAKQKKAVAKQVAKAPIRSSTARHATSLGRSLVDEVENEVDSQEGGVSTPNAGQVSQYKSVSEKNRESGSEFRALELLNESVAAHRALSPGQSPADTAAIETHNSDYDRIRDDGNVSEYKSDFEKYRMSCSESKAVALLTESVTGQPPVERAKGSLSAHEIDALRSYQGSRFDTTTGKEQMSITTRPKKPHRPEEETMAGMKCQLDLEREKLAQQKALRLLHTYEKYIF